MITSGNHTLPWPGRSTFGRRACSCLEAQALAVDLCDTVEFYFRKNPSASSRRAKCIRWGVVYIYEAGETPDEGAGGGGGSGGTTPPTQG